MQEAIEANTTRRRVSSAKRSQAAAKATVALPTVAEMGRIALVYGEKALDADEVRTPMDKSTPAWRAAEREYHLWDSRSVIVRNLIFASPIVTLADAAALAFQGYLRAELCGDDDMQRAFASITLLTARLAGVSLDDFVSSHSQSLLIGCARVVEAAQ